MNDWKIPEARQVLPVDAPEHAWLRERRNGIGGTDAATITGANLYSTVSDLLADKLDTSDPVPKRSPILDLGHAMEPHLAAKLADDTGIATRRIGLVRNREDSWRYANPDRLTADGGIAEFKTTSYRSEAADSWRAGRVPAHAAVQGQHYLAVTGRSHLYYAVGIRNDRTAWQDVPRRHWGKDWFAEVAIEQWITVGPVERDEDYIAQLIETEQRFMGCVERGELDEMFKAMLPVDKRYLSPIGGKLATPAIPALTRGQIVRYREILAQEKALKAEKDIIATSLKETIGDAEILLVDDQPAVTWKLGKPSRYLDEAAIEAEHPGLLDKYRKTKTAARRFTVKGIKA